LLFRHFRPVYHPPELYVLTPDSHRMGGGKWQVMEGILQAYDLLLGLHPKGFATLNEHFLEIPPTAKAILYPLPFCPPDAAFDKILKWVQAGGVLYLSGDISYDECRRRTRAQRLEQLCGVKFVEELYPGISLQTNNTADQPCIRVQPVTAKVLKETPDGVPLWLENRLGKGRVFFSTDPVELHNVRERRGQNREWYRQVLSAANLPTIALSPDDPLIHAFKLPLADGGTVHVLFNTHTNEPQTVTLKDLNPPLTLDIGPQKPALVWSDASNRLRALEVQGRCRSGGTSQPWQIADGTHGILLSLDREDLSRSRAVLAMPLQAGKISLPHVSDSSELVVQTGDFQAGEWKAYQTSPLTTSSGTVEVEVQASQVFSLLLICSRAELPRWQKHLNGMIKIDLHDSREGD
jgi:hypothetical protein